MGTADERAGEAAADAAALIWRARTAALATLDGGTGAPYVSLVTVACDSDGTPLLLLSGLARHTRNLERDPRASLLFTPASSTGSDPLAGSRVTTVGRLSPSASATARGRFLAAHPDAAQYADFADFAFYGLGLESAHFIGGFGRIVDIAGGRLQGAVAALAGG